MSSTSEFNFHIYFLEYACSKVWLGEDPFTWMDMITIELDSYVPTGDLAGKTWLCYFIFQLELHLKSVELGDLTFSCTQKYYDCFDVVKTLFPYSNVEIASMDRKIKEWTTKTDTTVAECKVMIKEMKIFLEPIYKKFANDQDNNAFKAYRQKLKSDNIGYPTSKTLKEVFLWMYDGNTSDGEKEWEEIIHSKHPDGVQIKRKLPTKSLKQKSTASSPSSLVNTLPGCSTDAHQDSNNVNVVSTKADRVAAKGKQPLKKKKPRNKMLRLPSNNNDSSEEFDIYPVITNIIEDLESSEDVIGPTQESSDDNPTGEMPMTNEQTKYDKLVKETIAATSNLQEASRNLMNIVIDPYEKKIQDSDEDTDTTQEFIMTRRKTLSSKQDFKPPSLCYISRNKRKWLAPQRNATVLNFTSSDEDDGVCDFAVDEKQRTVKGVKGRQKRYWTEEEVDWLKEGITRFGISNWAQIRDSYNFVGRTSVDIKDKYRNMLRNHQI